MKQTYRTTRKAVRDWWGELTRKGHVIVLLFALGLLLTLLVIIASTYYAARNKVLYQEKIDRNSERIDGLEKGRDK